MAETPTQVPTDTLWGFDARFRDTITRLLAAPGRTDKPVEASIPEALRSLLLCAPLHVVWRAKGEVLAASCPDMLSTGRTISEPGRVAELTKLAEPLGVAQPHPNIAVRITDRVGEPWGISVGVPREDGQLLIVLEGKPADPKIVAWMARYAQGLLELYSAVKALVALRRVQRDAEQAQLARSAREITSGSERTFAEYMRDAIRLLASIADHREPPDRGRVELAQNIAVWATQALLGIGWGGRTLEGSDGQTLLDEFCAGLERVAARSPMTTEVGHLYCLSGILRAALPSTSDLDWVDRTLPSSADPSLRLLVSWTALHEMARRVASGRAPAPARDDARWEAAARGVLPELARVLEERSLVENNEAGFVRNWARLWFCHVLLRASTSGNWWQGALLDDEKWRFRRDIAYVVRESIRFTVYGRREDYKFQPAAFADALRTLVEQHCLRVVHLAREYDVRSHLREVGEARGDEGYLFAAGHLQHLLEMYIGGHFLLSLRVAAPISLREDDKGLDGWSMAEVLASRAGWKPGAQSTLELLQAFSLAALFHDTGMLLFPRYARPSEGLCRADPSLEGALGDTEGTFRGAGTALVRRCMDDLRSADFLDATAEPALARWLDDQLLTGAPDHGLLGAWYLMRVTRPITSTPTEVVREALRAVLLHSLPTLTVDVERDPVAAFLLLCDELFEWEPFTRPGASPETPARSMIAMAADLRPRRSRARNLRLPGLTVRVEPDGSLSSWLALDPQDYERGWPRCELRLHAPERLESPVHCAWLTIGQNLGRIDRSRHGWGPRVTLASPVPLRLRAVGLSTFRLLGQVAHSSRHPARVSLERWLFEVGGFESDERGGMERVVVEARNHVLHGEDIRRAFRAITEDVERVVSEFERRGRT